MHSKEPQRQEQTKFPSHRRVCRGRASLWPWLCASIDWVKVWRLIVLGLVCCPIQSAALSFSCCKQLSWNWSFDPKFLEFWPPFLVLPATKPAAIFFCFLCTPNPAASCLLVPFFPNLHSTALPTTSWWFSSTRDRRVSQHQNHVVIQYTHIRCATAEASPWHTGKLPTCTWPLWALGWRTDTAADCWSSRWSPGYTAPHTLLQNREKPAT